MLLDLELEMFLQNYQVAPGGSTDNSYNHQYQMIS
jgi:hypothetical protein